MSWIDGGYTVDEPIHHRPSFDHAGAASASTTAGGVSGSADDAIVGASRRRRTKWIIPLCITGCYVLFTLAVHLRVLDSLDIAVRHATHAGQVWGAVQIRAARVVHWLQPAHVALPLVLLVAVLSVARRSLRPIAVMAVVGLPVIIVTLGTKWVMAHTETEATPVAHGSFPSGHAVSIIIVFGLIVLLLRPRTRWNWILPAVMGCVMGWALVVAAVHPATDVIGAGVLGIAALAIAKAAGLGVWASGGQGRMV